MDRGQLVVLDQAAGEDDGVLEVVALPRHEGDHQVLAQGHLALVGGGPVGEDVPGLDLLAGADHRLVVDQGPLVGAHELLELVLLLLAVVGLHDDLVSIDVVDRAGALGEQHVARVERGAALHAGAHQRGVGLQQRHSLALHVRAHQRAVGVVVLEERDHGGGHRPDLLGGHVHQVHVLGPNRHVLACLGAAEDLAALQTATLGVDRGVRLGDQELLFLGRVEVAHLARQDAVLDHPVGGGDEAVLGYLGERGQRADETDVGTLGGLDRAHAAVVGGVHVADLDRGPLAGQPAGTQGRQATAVGEPGQRVGLVHELAQLGGPEELLQGRHHRADVDDRLGGDGVGVLGGEALADHPLHAVEADPEGLLDQLADGPQAAVAEVLVLVEAVGDGLPGHAHGLGRVVLDLDLAVLGQAEALGQRDQLADEREDVVLGERAGVDVDVQPQA